MSGQISDNQTTVGGPFQLRNGATVIIKVEGRETARTVSSTIGGTHAFFRVTFDHPGLFRVEASFEGRRGSFSPARVTAPTRNDANITMDPSMS